MNSKWKRGEDSDTVYRERSEKIEEGDMVRREEQRMLADGQQGQHKSISGVRYG